jgi:hypothetical protein
VGGPAAGTPLTGAASDASVSLSSILSTRPSLIARCASGCTRPSPTPPLHGKHDASRVENAYTAPPKNTQSGRGMGG